MYLLGSSNDGEVRTLVSGGDHAVDQLAMHVELGPAREFRAPHLLRDHVDGERRARQRRDFIGVLHHADCCDNLRCAYERSRGQCTLEIE